MNMQRNLDLPLNWTISTIGEISENIQYGYTSTSSAKNTGVRYLRITDIQNNHVLWETVPYCEINKEEAKKYLLESGDIVFARSGATVGKSFLIGVDVPTSVFASYLIRIKPNKNFSNKYISYFFKSGDYWKQIRQGQSGIAQPNVNGKTL